MYYIYPPSFAHSQRLYIEVKTRDTKQSTINRPSKQLKKKTTAHITNYDTFMRASNV